MIAHIVLPRRSRRLLLIGCWLSVCLASAPDLQAAPVDGKAADAEPSAAPADEEKRVPVDPELKRWVWQALLMLGGIIVVGTLLLMVVVMWGNRTRRLARKPLPQIAKRDELWFLKPKPPTSRLEQQPEPRDADQ
ncbi:MAG TPA: hypothetical protein VGM05_10850 [Planctomycetaceae bacterium]